MKILIGPDGSIWHPDSNVFSRYFGFIGQNIDLVSFVIQNCGFAAIAAFPGYTRIRLQPELFSIACLQRVLEIILSRPPPRFVLERIGSLFAPLEVLHNLNDAIARLRALQNATPTDDASPGPPTIIPLSLDRLRDPKRASLKRAFTRWKTTHRDLTMQNVARIATDPAFGGGALAWMPGQDRCLVEAWPQTYKKYTDISHDHLLGLDIRDLPDAAYMLPATRSYFTVASDQKPRLELIEALMTSGDGAKFWCRYERLVLPWRASDSDIFVCSVPLVRLIRNCQG